MDASLVWNFNASRPDRRKEEEGAIKRTVKRKSSFPLSLSLPFSLYVSFHGSKCKAENPYTLEYVFVPVFKQLIRDTT